MELPGLVVGLPSTVYTCVSWQNGPCGLAELSAECFGWIRELVWLLWHGNCLQFMLNTAPYIMLTVPEHYKIISPFSLKTISNSRVIV